ncbi:golgin subfamily A member 6-like protein 22 isoform X1 [Varanus komodoensis]|uniref:golgin subfamily A member 6-like protein 22 isoform X1 n=2 Tax=Varanus komodoensis TaxID=61221 RepID=UPI001CF7B300|nr:golgin subfamily A member 6-like protein 22 isoform X1 [Varanus komodoensis]
MESFQRLLGSLQQAVNFISSFTAYLFGDEAHPGAEESRSTKNAHSCQHDGEVETKRDGDGPPRGPLGALEDPLGAEVDPTRQHVQVTSEAAVGGGQDTEAIVRREGEAELQQILSESSQLSGNGPEPRSMATGPGKISQRDLQGPNTMAGLHQREAEASIWMGAVQEGVLEERAATKWNQHWELDSSSAGSKDHGKLDGAGELNRGQEKGLEGVQWSEGILQGEPDLAWTGRSQHGEQEQAVKMVAGLQLEAEKKQGKEAENDQQDLAAKEGIQQGMLSRAETAEDQEQVLERGERVGRSLGWEPQGELEDVSGAEGNQERELEETLWNDRATDEVLFAGEEQRGLEKQAWTVGFQHGGLEMEAKMVEEQLAEAEKEHKGEAEVDENQQKEPDRKVAKDGIQQEMLSEAETVENKERKLEVGIEVRRSHELRPEELEEAAAEGTTQDQRKEMEEELWNEDIQHTAPDLAWTGRSQHGEQEQAAKMVESLLLEAEKEQEKEKEAENDRQEVAEKEGIQQGMLSRAETVEDQEQVLERGERVGRCLEGEPQGELEEVHGAEGNQERELEETLWNDRATDQVLFAGEEQRGLEEQAWSGGFQHGGLEMEAKMVEEQLARAEKEQEGEAEVKEDQQEEPDRGVEKKGIQQEMLSEVETVEDQERMLERVANVRRSHGWGAEEELEEAATGGTTQDQRKEVEEELRNEGVQQGAPEWALPEAEMEENQHRAPDRAVAKEGIQQAVLAMEEAKGDLEEVLEGEEQGVGCHWPETKEVVPAEVQDEGLKGVVGNRNRQHGELAGAEGTEEELEEPVRNGAQASGGEQEAAAREEWQGSDQEELMEKPAEDSRLEGGVLEDAETTEGQSRPLEETDSSLQQGNMEYCASIDTDAFSGLRTVLTEVTPLDTSAQKERVLLRRKSSIRRVPTLKRPRPSLETQPQETNIAEDAPSQPQLQAPRRPNLRHSGFGPMHPNMMAELQMRLRKPQ